MKYEVNNSKLSTGREKDGAVTQNKLAGSSTCHRTIAWKGNKLGAHRMSPELCYRDQMTASRWCFWVFFFSASCCCLGLKQ